MIDRIRRLDASWYVLIAIAALGLFLRAYGLNWDQGVYLHPDERFIAIVSYERVDLPGWNQLGELLDPAHSPLNTRRDDPNGVPLSFAYGSLPLFVQNVASWVAGWFSDTDYQAYPSVYRVGRALNVALDTLTIVLVFLLGRRLFDQRAAVVAAGLYALAVLPIQLSHFFTVDIWLNFFVTATLYLAIRYLDRPTMARALALAVPIGAAFATKASVPSLVVPLFVMAAWVVWRVENRRNQLANLALVGVVALAVFSLFEPYAIVRMGPFIQDIRLQADIVRGVYDVPFTRQFVGLTPGVYELRNLFAYGLGPAFLLASLAGLAFGLSRAWRRRDPALIILLAWVLAYIPTLLITEARFLRYSLPLVPVFAVLTSGLLTRPVFPSWPRLSRVVLALVLIVTAIWAFGFSTIYSKENPRITASRWMNENIPPGSVITAEYWDDAMPVPYPGAPPMAFTQIPFDIYADLPPEDKAAYIAKTLQAADYVVLSSDRIIDSVDNLPWRYAVQNEYYRRLTEGQLGFQLVYEASLQPELFGIRFDDTNADESFTVYDHPHVRIFKKVDVLSTAEIRERLLWGIQQEWLPQRYPPQESLLLDQPAGEIATTDDAFWNELAVNHAPIAIILWLLAIEAMGLAVLPIASLALRRAPDHGMFSARLLGLLIVGWFVWVGASLNLWPSRAMTVAIALAFVAGVSWAMQVWRARVGSPIPLPSKATYITSLGVWLGLFGFFLLLRAIYPDFWQTWFGGEKPFELAYLRAVSRSVSFPPYDPWYADGIINYYYYGWHLLATLVKLTGVGITHGFQLGSATFAGLFGLQLASLGAMLGGRWGSTSSRRLALTGMFVVVATLFIGNLDAFRQVIDLRGFNDQFDFWHSTRVIDFTINEFPYFSQIWADVHPHVINFPIFAFLLTLVGAVALSGRWSGLPALAPIAALCALVLGSIIVTNAWDAPMAAALTVLAFAYVGALRSWHHAVVGLMFGLLIVGSAFVLFLPFHEGFYSVVQGVGLTSMGSALDQFLTVWGIFFGLIALVILADVLRRPLTTRSLYDGVGFGALAIIAAVGSAAVDLLLGRPALSGIDYPALFIVTAVVSTAAIAARPTLQPPLFVVLVAFVGALAGILTVYRPAAAVALAIATAAGMYVVRYRAGPARVLPWVFIAIAAVTITATEIVYIADDLQNSDWERMNTVFKFYLQSWILLAVGSAVLLARLWQAVSRRSFDGVLRPSVLGVVAQPLAASSNVTRARAHGWVSFFAASFGTLLLLTGLLYPVAGTPVRLSWDMPSTPAGLTLDGYAWMNGGQILNGTGDTIDFTGDLAAIRWLEEHARGNAVILEASIGPYRGNGARISSATGLPAVLGWDRHQRQQRYWPGIDRRIADVRAIYNEVDPQRKLEMLRRYGVRYVIVGDVERYWNTADNPTYYASGVGLRAFDELLGSGLELVFQAGNTRIYEMSDFSRIPPAENARHEL